MRKNMNKLIASAIAVIGFATTSNAQATATASTTAVLVTPISIVKTTDMHFGTVAASGTAGSVVLGWTNGRIPYGGVTLPAVGTPLEKTAVFTVTGEGTSSFSIAVPTSSISLSDGGSASMTVSDFTVEGGTPSSLVSGTKVVKVGATLNVKAAQTAGTYTNASGLFVTVNYN